VHKNKNSGFSRSRNVRRHLNEIKFERKKKHKDSAFTVSHNKRYCFSVQKAALRDEIFSKRFYHSNVSSPLS
jgi:hypothetical protein